MDKAGKRITGVPKTIPGKDSIGTYKGAETVKKTAKTISKP